LVEAFNQLGITSKSQVLPLFQKKLLVDEVAQDVFLTLAEHFVRVRWILLFHVIFELILAAEEFRPSDDLAVHARDNFFNHLACRESWDKGHTNEDEKHSFHRIFGGPPRCLGLRAKVG